MSKIGEESYGVGPPTEDCPLWAVDIHLRVFETKEDAKAFIEIVNEKLGGPPLPPWPEPPTFEDRARWN